MPDARMLTQIITTLNGLYTALTILSCVIRVFSIFILLVLTQRNITNNTDRRFFI